MIVITVMMVAMAARPDTRGEGPGAAGRRQQPLVSFNEVEARPALRRGRFSVCENTRAAAPPFCLVRFAWRGGGGGRGNRPRQLICIPG